MSKEKNEHPDYEFTEEEVQDDENGKKGLSPEDREKIAHNMKNFKLYKSNSIPERLRS